MKRAENKISPKKTKSISEYKVSTVVINIFLHPSIMPVAIKFIWTVFNNYLVTQFFQKWGIFKIPVAHVDHPLDKEIPFKPEKVGIYMGFIKFFIKPVAMIKKTQKVKIFRTVFKTWFRTLGTAYKEAGRMYKHTLSTMERPNYTETKYFRTIHKYDPHLLCVPSLHIAIVVLCWAFFRKTLKTMNMTEHDINHRTTELYNEAIAISESVLYVKQHSVNCIPAAIYMVTKVFPDLLKPSDAVNFINDMFLTTTDIKKESIKNIKAHINFIYERFLLEGAPSDDWREPVIRWISSYNTENEKQN